MPGWPNTTVAFSLADLDNITFNNELLQITPIVTCSKKDVINGKKAFEGLNRKKQQKIALFLVEKIVKIANINDQLWDIVTRLPHKEKMNL